MKKMLFLFLSLPLVITGMKENQDEKIKEKVVPALVKNVLNGVVWTYKETNLPYAMLYSREKKTALIGTCFENKNDIPQKSIARPMLCEFLKNHKRFYFLVIDAGEPPKND